MSVIFVRLYPKLNFTNSESGNGEMLFAADWTDVTRLIVFCRNFVAASEKTPKEKGVNWIRLLTTVFTGGPEWAQQ